jgi:CubicO group peptidase (beta-lactamase class C family)
MTVVTVLVLVAGCSSPKTATWPSSSTGTDNGYGGTSVVFPAPATSALPTPGQHRLQAVLTGALALHAASVHAGARGLTAAIVSDRGAWAASAGVDGRNTPLPSTAMVSVDSITKTFVAAEVLLLAKAGKVQLDAPLSRYVEEPVMANGATVRQVLSMRSGVGDPPGREVASLVKLAQSTSPDLWTLQHTLDYLKPTAAAPGGAPAYANVNYLLLGLLIEKVTGRSMARVLRADLFTPARLGRIAAQDEESPTPPLGNPEPSVVPTPDGYLPSRAIAHLAHDTFAGIAADAPTLALWGYDLYGSRLLPAASVRTMTSQPSTDYVFPSVGYALGTMVFYQLSTDAAYGHEGSGPASSSILVVVPARHLSLAVLAPEEGRDLEPIATDLLRAFP